MYERPTVNLQGFIVLLKENRKKLEELEFEPIKRQRMRDFVNHLRTKINLEDKMFAMVFGARTLGGTKRGAVTDDMKEESLHKSITQIKNYNSLKKVIDNCSFDIEIGEDGLIVEK